MNRIRLVLLFCLVCTISHAAPPSSFSKAKKIALLLFNNHQTTLYCGCHWAKDKKVDLNTCHMDQASSHSRAHEIEWEHMVPASHLGENRACWTQDLCKTRKGKPYHGRTCCRIVDKTFRTREAELYNLWPSDGLINQLRQNYAYAALPYTHDTYGCRFIIDGTAHLVEPNDSAKGVVARASLFMAEHYGIRFDEDQKALFEHWNTLYPPDDWEKEWSRLVKNKEGYENTYITHHA